MFHRNNIYEHLLVVVKSLNRPLLSDEIVHHKNTHAQYIGELRKRILKLEKRVEGLEKGKQLHLNLQGN